MQKTDVCVCRQAVVACSFVCTSGVNISWPHVYACLNECSISAWFWGEQAFPALSIKCVVACVSASAKSLECKRPSLRCPLGSCDCAKAEHCVQRAAALRKSLLLLLQTGSGLPETCFLEDRREGELGKLM